jgi:tight adherence protein B
MSGPEVAAAAGLAAGVVLLLLPGTADRRLDGLLTPTSARSRRPTRIASRPGQTRAALAAAAFGLALALAPAARSIVVPAALAAAAGTAGLVAWTRFQRARATAALRDAVIELCRGTAAEVRAGLAPEAALAAALSPLISPLLATRPAPGRSPPASVGTLGLGTGGGPGAGVDEPRSPLHPLHPLLWAARSGGDVAAALRACASVPGAGGLVRMAVCWQVSAGTGAALAESLDRVGEGMAAEEAVRREVAAALAGPKATARLLAALPLAGVFLGSALGGAPVGFLLGTPVGLACAATGTVLVLLGTWWTGRMARSVMVA